MVTTESSCSKCHSLRRYLPRQPFPCSSNEQPRKADHPRRSRCKCTPLKFTTEQVRIIREQRAAGVSAMEIATMYGVNVTTIHRIISERTHVKEAKRQREIETRIKENTPSMKKPRFLRPGSNNSDFSGPSFSHQPPRREWWYCGILAPHRDNHVLIQIRTRLAGQRGLSVKFSLMKHSTTRTGWWGPRKSCANSSTAGVPLS